MKLTLDLDQVSTLAPILAGNIKFKSCLQAFVALITRGSCGGRAHVFSLDAAKADGGRYTNRKKEEKGKKVSIGDR